MIQTKTTINKRFPPNQSKETLRVIVCSRPEREIDNLCDPPQLKPQASSNLHYHFVSSKKRNYILTELTSYDERHNLTLALAASIADVAMIHVDASQSLFSQAYLASRMIAIAGIRHVILAIGGMDWMNDDATSFNAIKYKFCSFAADLGFTGVYVVPDPGLNMNALLQKNNLDSWYTDACLLDCLDGINVHTASGYDAFHMQVHWVNHSHNPDLSYDGQIIAGTIKAGDSVRILPSGTQTQIRTILKGTRVKGTREVNAARSGDSVSLTFSDDIAAGCGDIVTAADSPLEVADQFEADLLWLNKSLMLPGRQYLMKVTNREVTTTITEIKYREDIHSGAHLAAKMLTLNEIGRVKLSTSAPLVFEHHGVHRALNHFFLIDRLTQETMGTGLIDFALRRASNIHWQVLELNKETRSVQKNQTPKCVWFTGLSGSGKSTIANLLEKRLHQENKHTYLLDGDNVRHGLNRDLGFTEADRVENIRRVAEVAKLMVDAGLIVLVSFISPFRSERRMARELFVEKEFIEVFVDTDLEECERRDTKGLYAKARSGNLKNFTGIDSPYEPPVSPEVRIPTALLSPEAGIEMILKLLK